MSLRVHLAGVGDDLLGAHVQGRPHGHAGPRDERFPVLLVAPEDLGDAEVEDLQVLLAGGLAVEQHQVRRLEVAVDDPLLVGDLEHGAELRDDPRPSRAASATPGFEDLVEALAPDVLHLDVGGVAVGADHGVVDGDGVGMAEPGHHPRLAPEPCPYLAVERDARDDQLQGPLDVEVVVPDQPDLAHPPLAQLADQEVLAEQESAGLHRAALGDRVEGPRGRRGWVEGTHHRRDLIRWERAGHGLHHRILLQRQARAGPQGAEILPGRVVVTALHGPGLP